MWSQIMCTVRNYRHNSRPAIEIVNCVKALRTWKKAFVTFLEEMHNSSLSNSKSKYNREFTAITNFELNKSKYFKFLVQIQRKYFLQIVSFKMYLPDSVTTTQRDCYTLWLLHSVTVTQCEGYTVVTMSFWYSFRLSRRGKQYWKLNF